MTFQAYTGWGECVNSTRADPAHPGPHGDTRSTPSTLPNVVRKQRGRIKRKAFEHFYAVSDAAGYFELDAARAAEAIGCARKTVYEAVAFLQRVNLLRLVTYRTGRGQHSTYWLNWRKPDRRTSQKCHPPKNPRSNKTNTAMNDPRSSHGNQSERQLSRPAQRPPTDEEIDAKLERVRNLVRAERADPAKRLMLMTLRWSAWSAGLARSEQGAIVQAAGRVVWAEPLAHAWAAVRRLIQALRRGVWFCEIRDWLWWVRESKGKCEALRACFAYLTQRLGEIVRAERAWDERWSAAEVEASPPASEAERLEGLSVWRMAFEGLHGRPPTAAEERAYRRQVGLDAGPVQAPDGARA